MISLKKLLGLSSPRSPTPVLYAQSTTRPLAIEDNTICHPVTADF